MENNLHQIELLRKVHQKYEWWKESVGPICPEEISFMKIKKGKKSFVYFIADNCATVHDLPL